MFTGNPGTGKTTVARLIGQIYRTLGVVDKGQLVETERAGLVAGYMGQTALKTTEVFTAATGGLLLIDEAYALVRGRESDFGREAIDTLVKLMEDHRDEVVVIAAGYPEEMAEFLDANPGLRSRFPRTIHFPDYTTDELVAIFEAACRESSYRLTPEAVVTLRASFDAEPRAKGFGNGRLARNLFEAAVGRQASRIVSLPNPTDDELCSLVAGRHRRSLTGWRSNGFPRRRAARRSLGPRSRRRQSPSPVPVSPLALVAHLPVLAAAVIGAGCWGIRVGVGAAVARQQAPAGRRRGTDRSLRRPRSVAKLRAGGAQRPDPLRPGRGPMPARAAAGPPS